MRQSFIRFDVFRKMPKDLTEATYCGALVSLICTLVLVTLCFAEFTEFITIDTKSEMKVDIQHHDDRLNINVDIVFPKMPCELLNLDVQDVMGTHISDIAGSLYKKRLSQQGEFLSQTSMLEMAQSRENVLQRVKDELKEKQGCQLQGFVLVNRVPGNFHVSSHVSQDLMMSLASEGFTFDFSYKINHVSFGFEEDYLQIQRKFKKLGVLNPLDGMSARPNYDNQNKPMHLQTNFYLIAVPSFFRDVNGNMYSMHQLTMNHNTNLETAENNIIIFNYELSPISVLYYQEKESILEFFIHICAIIGGIFTVAGIIDAIIYRSFSVLFKERIGKLS